MSDQQSNEVVPPALVDPPPSTLGMLAKVLNHLAIVALGALSIAYSDAVITGEEWVVVIGGPVLGALAVKLAPVSRRIAAYVSALVAGLATLGTGLADGDLTQPEVIVAVVAVLIAIERVHDTSAAPVSEALRAKAIATGRAV